MEVSREFLAFLTLFALVSMGLWVRFRPLRINPSLGVDNWYWILCAEDVKRRRRLPSKLPYFMLEIEEQWYPPLFAGFLALLPIRWLRDHSGKISQIIDLSHVFIIFFGVLWFSNSLIIGFLAGLSYLIAWFPVSYNTQLQPRGLANVLLTLTMGGLWFYIQTGSWGVWCGVLAGSVVLLFLHKMTVQMWIVYLLGFGIWAWDWRIVFLIPASVMVALIVSKGFYIKMLKAHWDIVSFWHENIAYLGSHQYYESVLYRDKAFVSTALHKPGYRHQIRKLFSLYKYNAFVLIIPVLGYCAIYQHHGKLDTFLWVWLGLSYAWTLLTTFVPYFFALGGGYYYTYQTFVPLFLLIGIFSQSTSACLQSFLFGVWGMGLLYSVVKWEKYCRTVHLNKTSAIGDDLMEVLNYLKLLPKEGVYCIPFTLPDGAAFWGRKKVFWGGHSYGFHALLKPFFPIMREDVKETLKKWPLNYLLFWRGYLKSLSDIGLEEGRDIRYLFGKGEYELYEVVK